jgi:hypothetical protein
LATTSGNEKSETPFVLIIAGTRTFYNYDFFCEVVKKTFNNYLAIYKIISGGARGTDTLAEMFAKQHLIPFEKFPANWESEGKFAGISRNRKMADAGDTLLAFWDGNSRGTKNMIHEMKLRNKAYYIQDVKNLLG